MKKKIIGILICTLFLATAVPGVTSLKNNAINTELFRISQTNMPGNWTEMQKLLASDGGAWELFGNGVAVDGDMTIMEAIPGLRMCLLALTTPGHSKRNSMP
jgi:hypothetical protein